MKMDDIYDDIRRCIRAEGGETGTVFIRKKDLAEFIGSNAAPSPAAETRQVPPRRERMEQPRPAPEPAFRPPVREASAAPCSPAPDVSGCAMSEVRSAAENCFACPLAATRRNVVFSDGSEKAELMFIGEGPGADEDAQGVPFVGAAGQLLTKMIAAMGRDRVSGVYICNIVKCRPPGNRNPADEEAAACLPYLRRQIELVKPKVIVLLGAVPLKFLMNKTGITRLRGKWMEYNGIQVMPTYHPAYLLRNPAAKRDVWNDLQIVMKYLEKP